MNPFEFCLEHVLSMEGGFVDNPLDRGGPTNFGITLATLSAYRQTRVTASDVKALERSEAAKIYRSLYWNPSGVEKINNMFLQCILFDQIVNRGIRGAVWSLQKVLNEKFGTKLTLDGVLGPLTAAAANGVSLNPINLRFEYIKAAQAFYVDLAVRDRTQLAFLKGWIARTWKLFDLLI